uniref:Uncharacterized protein n=1 Tax=Amphimedon queenslandica TaxID=400682 RepID=A0A1X7SJ22_AMPQE
MKTLNEIGIDSNHLPNPELNIIVNGQPTKSNNVWCSLVDVNKIKAALRKLKEINWLYRNVDDSIDELCKNFIQVLSNTNCKMLEKANDQDFERLSAYTIRDLDSKIATGSDISQYKVMNVKEAPIDIGKSILICYAFLLYFLQDNMESIMSDKAIQHRLYHLVNT